MKVTAVNLLEDCIDGSFRKKVVLDRPVDLDFIQWLGTNGILLYFHRLPRPFFRIDGERFVLKGIEKNTYIEMLVFDRKKEAELLEWIEGFPERTEGKRQKGKGKRQKAKGKREKGKGKRK